MHCPCQLHVLPADALVPALTLLAIANVGCDGGGEEHRLLADQPDVAPHAAQLQAAQWVPIQQHLAGVGVVEPARWWH